MGDTEAARDPRVGDGIVFYGSLMRGLGALDGLPSREGLRYVGPCRIEGELYDLGPYPGVRLSGTSGTSAPGAGATAMGAIVQAELHSILDLRVVEELDHFEGFEPDQPETSLYLRQRVKLIAPAKLPPEHTQAWVYIYNHTPDPSQRVDSGDWRAHLMTRAQSGASADFSPREEQSS